jgi:hypothetical protein
VHQESILAEHDDLGLLHDPTDLRVQFEPGKLIDHSFTHDLVALAETARDGAASFPGDMFEPSIIKVPQWDPEVLSVKLIDDGYPAKIFTVRFSIPVASMMVSEQSGDRCQIQLDGIQLCGASPQKVTCEEATVVERPEGHLVLQAQIKMEFDDDQCDFLGDQFGDLTPISGPLVELVEAHRSKLVREGVFTETGTVPAELSTRLGAFVDKLNAESIADYHPGSNNVVRDIVHPSLFPFVEGVSTVTGLAGDFAKVGGNSLEGNRKDMWGRPYETSKYQWLPSEVLVSDTGKCKFETYINNLDQKKHDGIYLALEELLSRCLPLLEASWAHGSSIEVADSDEDFDDSDMEAGDPKEMEDRSLRNRTIQVITKIVDFELPAGGKHEGVWHVEGMSHENIVATAEYILQKDDCLSGGNLEFQRQFTRGEGGSMFRGFSQCRPSSLNYLVEKGLVPLGHLPLPVGRLASWPNSHVHRVTELRNTGSALAKRRIVVFWLINPDVRIVSTKNVTPQQATMSMDDAHKYRLALMEERKRHKEKWNLREVTLCEH